MSARRFSALSRRTAATTVLATTVPLAAAVLGAPAAQAAPAAATTPPVVTAMTANRTTVSAGNAVTFTVRVNKNGTRWAGAKVLILRAKVGSSVFTAHASGVTGKYGAAWVVDRPSATYRYAAVAVTPTGRVPAGVVSTVTVTKPKVTAAQKVLAVAASLKGRPYVYGAAGPRSFDCSGYTMYVFRKAVGESLPHNAAAQYSRSKKVARSSIRPGDLVFFTSGGSVYHVAIYAGGGRIWAAPRTGETVRLEPIFSSSWVAGRLI
jgi:cell wall-associated NlpC family hydrolase